MTLLLFLKPIYELDEGRRRKPGVSRKLVRVVRKLLPKKKQSEILAFVDEQQKLASEIQQKAFNEWLHERQMREDEEIAIFLMSELL